MKETKSFDKWIGMLSISVVAIVAIVFVVMISNTHLAKGTYAAVGDTCYYCTGVGGQLSGTKCISYETNTLNGWNCTWDATGAMYVCEKSAIVGAIGANGNCGPKCSSNQVLYNGNCTTIGSSCGSHKIVTSSGTCDCEEGYVKNGFGICIVITSSTCDAGDGPKAVNGQWCTCEIVPGSGDSGVTGWQCRSCSEFSASQCPTALCSVSESKCTDKSAASSAKSCTGSNYSTKTACQTAANSACNGSYTGCTNASTATGCYTYTCVGNPSAEQKTCYCGYCNTTTNTWEVNDLGPKDERTCNSGCRNGTPGWGSKPTTKQCGTNSSPSAVESKMCYCNTCTSGQWKKESLGSMTRTNCNSATCAGTRTWGEYYTGSCGNSECLKTNRGAGCYLCSGTYKQYSEDPEISKCNTSKTCSKYGSTCPATSSSGGGGGGGGTTPTPSSSSKKSSSSVKSSSSSKKSSSSIKSSSYIAPPSSSEPVNPETGSAAVIAAWLIGLFAIGYSFWYFKRVTNN